jgi:hypothetical protein
LIFKGHDDDDDDDDDDIIKDRSVINELVLIEEDICVKDGY